MSETLSDPAADLLYTMKAYKVLPLDIVDEIQDILEDCLAAALQEFERDIKELNCLKNPEKPPEIASAAIADIPYFDACMQNFEDNFKEKMRVPPHILLPEDEFLRSVEEDALMERIETRRLIAMKMNTNEKLRQEIALLKEKKRVAQRLKEAKRQVLEASAPLTQEINNWAPSFDTQATNC